LQHNLTKYYPLLLVLVAVGTVALFGHGTLSLRGAGHFKGRNIPDSSSVEMVQFAAANRFASGQGLALTGDMAQFPETVACKSGMVPAYSPAYIALLSIPARWADRLTPKPDEIRVSSQLEAEKANWEREYLNYTRRYKLTVIFFQGPFLVLLLLFFYAASHRVLPDPASRLWLTLGLCFGTLAYPFALTVNPIFPAAVLLLCGFHYLLNFSEKPEVSDGVAAGLFIGAAFFLNHLAYIPAVVMIVAVAIKLREPERLLPIIGGLVPGVAVFIIAHILVFGDPLPAIYHRGGAQSGMLVIWKHLIWSILGYNGALWMAPATAFALVYALASGKGNGGLRTLSLALGIAACLLLLAAALEDVYTFAPLVDPSNDKSFEDVYSAERAASPQLEVNVVGFPMSVKFHTMIFGGEALALMGPSLFLLFGGVFGKRGYWGGIGSVLLRIGIFIGVFAAFGPFGGRIFPLIENIHLFAYEIALRIPREAIF